MNGLFSQLTLADTHQNIARNMVSLHPSQILFDDLSPDPAERVLAQKVGGRGQTTKLPLAHTHHRPPV